MVFEERGFIVYFHAASFFAVVLRYHNITSRRRHYSRMLLCWPLYAARYAASHAAVFAIRYAALRLLRRALQHLRYTTRRHAAAIISRFYFRDAYRDRRIAEAAATRFGA